jgi:hypothetical protein
MKKIHRILFPFALLIAWAPLSANFTTYAFTFNNEGKVGGLDRTIQDGNWDGVYSPAALPAVTGTAIFADLSEGVIGGMDAWPGAYKAGFMFVSGKNDQPAPGGFLLWSGNTTVVSEPQWPQGGLDSVNPQTAWYSPDADAVGNLNQLRAGDLLQLEMVIAPRNAATANYRFAIQVAGDWYVSEQVFQADGNSVWTTVSLDIQAANWLGGITGPGFLNLDFVANPPTVLTIADLFDSALLNTVGIYIDTGDAIGQNDSWARVDNVVLTAVPEPAAYAALLAGAALALVLLRRRR